MAGTISHSGSQIRDAIEQRTRAEGIDLKRDYVHFMDVGHMRGVAHYFVHQQAWASYAGTYPQAQQIFALCSFAALDDGEVLKSRSTRIVVGENLLRVGSAAPVRLLPMSSDFGGAGSVPLLGGPEAAALAGGHGPYTEPQRHLCTCPMRELLMYGCRCGGR